MQWRDNNSITEGYHQYCGSGNHGYCEGIPSILWKDTISTVEGYHQYLEGYHQYCVVISSELWGIPSVHSRPGGILDHVGHATQEAKCIPISIPNFLKWYANVHDKILIIYTHSFIKFPNVYADICTKILKEQPNVYNYKAVFISLHAELKF